MVWKLPFDLAEEFESVVDAASAVALEAKDWLNENHAVVEHVVETASLPSDAVEKTVTFVASSVVGVAAHGLNEGVKSVGQYLEDKGIEGASSIKLFDGDNYDVENAIYDFTSDGMDTLQQLGTDDPINYVLRQMGLDLEINTSNPFSADDYLIEIDSFRDDVHAFRKHNLVDFNYVLEHGGVPSYEFMEYSELQYVRRSDSAGSENAHYIDWNSDDAYTRAMGDMKENLIAYIENDQELQDLLGKDEWTTEDRVQWERTISSQVSRELQQVPGLDTYRTMSDEYPDTRTRATRINDVSQDMERGTQEIEFDCETMSITEGVLMQQLENHFLPQTEDSELRSATRYFYSTGSVIYGAGNTTPEGHAFIVSEATGNIIEGTAGGSSYRTSRNPDHTFSDLVEGNPFNTARGDTYIFKNVRDMDEQRVLEAKNDGIGTDRDSDRFPTSSTHISV